MKKSALTLLAAMTLVPMLSYASCDSVKADIQQKIIKNGVAETAFTLDVVPNDQADQQGGLVVGHCENDQQKIVYKRTGE
ncbi:DUF1161 domain-containing protein [Rosenbergiella australiborealis]|uniref:DUF1161 domain-containing protein n=1 Tax=Rosenbergiella australiborealis TaxID=1544696 RepID=A0ABS5T250_9GAMM|nr:DUF1161 domain-containing protein [Rosenbergiella australiborealis]MBT0726411.1 DUF1161 domain-containing protein [Rosenbergiella australiborealis]